MAVGHEKLKKIVSDRWKETFVGAQEDTKDFVGVPYPYVVPCINASFRNLYYWDTVFASYGLVISGYKDVARKSCDDLLFLADKFSFVPNAAHPGMLDRSQVPMLDFLVEEISESYNDDGYAVNALPTLEKEYDFWMANRRLSCGLNRYGHQATATTLKNMYASCGINRLGFPKDASEDERLKAGNHIMAEAESGWDFNPRYENRCLDFAPVDLNAIMFRREKFLADWNKKAGNERKAEKFERLASERLKKFNELCCDEKSGCYFDYDTVNARRGKIVSGAAFFPLWCGCATKEQASKLKTTLLAELEGEHGIFTCAKGERKYLYQWDYPNVWAPLQIAAMNGLKKYGFDEDAARIGKKFADVVLDVYNATGDLWEKYDGETGTAGDKREYGTPAMQGWTAAAYLVSNEYCKKT